MKRSASKLRALLSLCLCVSLSGCVTGSYGATKSASSATIGTLGYRAAAYQGVGRNPVIVIPGIFGSELINDKTKEVAWGTFRGTEAFTHANSFGSARQLYLPMKLGAPITSLSDQIVPNGILNTVQVRLLSLPLQVSAYHDLMEILSRGGYWAEGISNPYDKDYYTAFQFSYDWRKDLAWNAKRLHEFIKEKRVYIQQEYEKHHGVKNHPVQFDIVAHSMGGLLSRYYMRYGDADLPSGSALPEVTWKGSQLVDKVILVGTPNGGYVDTFVELNKGLVFAPGTPRIEPAVLGTFPTYYQMLPLVGGVVNKSDINTVLDIFDLDLWIEKKWGLANPKQDKFLKRMLPGVTSKEERREIALDHLRKCLARAKQFSRALNIGVEPPPDVTFHLFVGNAIMTNALVLVDELSGKIKGYHKEPGDGKVTGVSAVYDRRYWGNFVPYIDTPIHWRSTTMLFSGHLGITSSPVFAANIWYILHKKPQKKFWGLLDNIIS